jgi:hypothetical protein
MYLEDVFTLPGSLAGVPGLVAPCGFSEGLPVGLQLIGRPFDEATLLRAGDAYQRITDWHTHRPALTPSQLLTVHGRLVAQGSERHAYQATFHIYEAYRTWLLRLLTFDMARRMYESVATNPSVVLKQFLKCSSKGQSSNLLPGSARRRVLKARLNRRRNLELKLRR